MTGGTNPNHPRRSAVFWVIVKKGVGWDEALTVNLETGKEALAVFGFEDEARMFLFLGTLGAGWQLKETTAGELTSMLLGPWAGIGFVSLDPLPELVYKGMVGLVSLRKEQFMDGLINSSRFRGKAGWLEPV